MAQKKKCKNCNKVLPDGYKHKYCEACLNDQISSVKKGAGIFATVAASILILFRGKK